MDRDQSVLDWWDMSLTETCIPVLTCICGNRFFAPLAKRKSSPNHVHTCLECSVCIPQYNTVRTVVVLNKVTTYILNRSFIEPYIICLCIWCDYHVYSVICISCDRNSYFYHYRKCMQIACTCLLPVVAYARRRSECILHILLFKRNL